MGIDLPSSDGVSLTEPITYCQLVGASMHLANTVRLDIAFAVHYLARFMHYPSIYFWKAGNHILNFLKEIMTLRIRFFRGIRGIIKANSDAN